MGRRRPGLTRRGALGALGLGAAAAACGERPEAPRYNGEVAFNHGVASGDPRIDRMIIWTRVTPEQDGPVPVRWIVARNEQLTDVVQTGVVETDARRDFTVKIDVEGLRQGAPYFYGFLAGTAESPVGRMRTLKHGPMDRVKIAVVSCASFPHGFFNVYEALSREDDLELVVHLGDYIYEYGTSGFGGDVGVSLGRIPQPDVECRSLGDYRLRHAQYKRETELQVAHAKCAWVCVWDDHEVANDSWLGGAQNHTEATEGAWSDRKRAALQAYYEWMPIRDPVGGRSFEAINRSFQFGDLFTLIMLETRLLARTRPLDYTRDLPVYSTPWDFTNPDAPVAISPSAPRGPNVRMLPVPYEPAEGGGLKPVFDYARVRAAMQSAGNLPDGMVWTPDRRQLAEMLNSPERQMLGAQQEAWLSSQLTNSKNGGTVWQVIGNQVLMAPVLAPDLHAVSAQAKAAAERAQPGARMLMEFTRFPIPLSTDSWDGYPRARQRVLEMMKRVGGNTIVLTGDTHAAWANEVLLGGDRVAVELGTASVTSPSAGDVLEPAGVDFAASVMARNPHVKWNQQTKRGYLRLTLERGRAEAVFLSVSTVRGKGFQVNREAVFEVSADEAPGTAGLRRTDVEG